ncbi:Zinc transporter 33D [Carabus blaptoides fortunei]
MEPLYCEHHRDGKFDKNLLLDDENAILMNGDCRTCIRCRKQSTNGLSLTATAPLFNIEDVNWRTADRNGSLPNTMFSNSVAQSTESRLSINSTESIDAPLLLNERYNEFDGIEEFHCHFNNIQSRDNKALKKLLAASCMCLFFMITEIIGGYLANSLSVMTDAAHLMSDFIGFLVSLFSIWIGQRTRTKRMSFGFHRAEVLGALFSIVVVWLLTGIFIYLALYRLIHGKYEINADTMMIVAIIGVFINIVMGLILHGGCSLPHTHSHGGLHHHGHQHAGHEQSKNNINVRAAVIHVLGDLIQSVGVFCAALIIRIYPSAKVADPICTFVFSIIVIFTTKNVLRDTLNVLMEGFPLGIDYNSVASGLATIEGVRHVHSLHIWSLTLNKNALVVHLAVDTFCDKEEVLSQATRMVKLKYSISNATIQIETYKADVITGCQECHLPKE